LKKSTVILIILPLLTQSEADLRAVNRNNIRLYPQDCIEGIRKRLTENSIDLVVTSPPYNIGVKYNTYNDKLTPSGYLEWTDRWGQVVKNALKETGSLFLNIGSRPSRPEVPFRVLEILSKHFKLQNTIHWIKSIYIESDSYGQQLDINVGHYKPINSPRFVNDTHEYIFHLTKTGQVPVDRLALGVPYKDKSNVSRWRSGRTRRRCRGNCWFIPYSTIQNRQADRPHPASFPPQLAENCIRLHGIKKGLKVLDPFMGIGNTGLACRKLNVEFIGFEVDPYYFKVAREKLMKGVNTLNT
jgi:site-specific DNA-methyltransferase (adenine-specific)